DYFSVPEEQIKAIESVLTIVGGEVVYASEEFASLAPPALPVSPGWSPVAKFGGYAKAETNSVTHVTRHHPHGDVCAEQSRAGGLRGQARSWVESASGLWALSCDCFAI